jgi:sortase A
LIKTNYKIKDGDNRQSHAETGDGQASAGKLAAGKNVVGQVAAEKLATGKDAAGQVVLSENLAGKGAAGSKEKFRKMLSGKPARIIAILIAVVSMFLILAPLMGEILLPLKELFDSTGGYVYQNKLVATDNQTKIDQSKLKPIPKENVLVIPKIQVDAIIHEGPDDSTLNLGVWRKPNSFDPELGGNTVLTAHRFLYTFGPNTFYSLDKIEKGDKFIIFWNQKEYDYEVFEKLEVQPTDVWVEDNTTDPTVTLYTCTKDAVTRIVVRAKLITSANN